MKNPRENLPTKSPIVEIDEQPDGSAVIKADGQVMHIHTAKHDGKSFGECAAIGLLCIGLLATGIIACFGALAVALTFGDRLEIQTDTIRADAECRETVKRQSLNRVEDLLWAKHAVEAASYRAQERDILDRIDRRHAPTGPLADNTASLKSFEPLAAQAMRWR